MSSSTGAARAESLSSVTNAIRLLKQFADTRGELGVTELARALDMSKSTAHRLLSTLVQENLLERDSSTGRYRLGVVVYELGLAVPLHRQLHLAATPVMEALRARIGESVYIHVLRGRQTYQLVRVEGGGARRLAGRVRASDWANCSSTGKVLLANLPPDELTRLMTGWRLPRATSNSITSEVALHAELAKIRRLGYAVSDGEAAVDIVDAAAPIRSSQGGAVAALTIVAPKESANPAKLQGFARLAVDGALAVSKRLAHV